MMEKRIVWIPCVLAVLGFGCSDDSSGKSAGTPAQNTCESTCSDCQNGVCMDDVDKDPNKCDPECKDGKICQNGECVDDPAVHHGEPEECSTECAIGTSCQKGECVADVCETACGEDEICINGECADKLRVCGDELCEAGKVCDPISAACESACESGELPCDGECCASGTHCDTDFGSCVVDCGEGHDLCGFGTICCGDGQKCVNGVCTVDCTNIGTYCGSGETAVCCADGQVCETGQCKMTCSGTRCGENEEYCCTGEEACIFNKCLKGTACTEDTACQLDEFCDVENQMCIKVSENPNSCIYIPPVDAFQPKVKWHWDGESQIPPVIMNLTDDNGDGKIDTDDVPDVVIVDRPSRVVALNGDTGTEIAVTSKFTYSAGNDIAGADIDNDGVVEILVSRVGNSQHPENAGLAGLSLRKKDDGTYEWDEDKYFIQFPDLAGPDYVIANPTVADLDSDGTPEVITSRGVIKGNDWSKFQCRLKMPQIQNQKGYIYMLSVADLDQDGISEIIGNDIYDGTRTDDNGFCKKILPESEAGWYYAAIADLVPDEPILPKPENSSPK